MARGDQNHLARIHAIWTLEGLGSLDAKFVQEKLKDRQPQVRIAAVRASETLFKAGDATLKPDVLALVKDPDPNVVLQIIGGAKVLKWPDWQFFASAAVVASKSPGVKSSGNQLLYSPKPLSRNPRSALTAGREAVSAGWLPVF